MRLRSSLAGFALLMALSAIPALAEECPAASTGMDDIVAALTKAPSCDRAMKIFEACEFGASGDVAFGAVVTRKCEGDFLNRLKEPRKLTYRRELRACDHKYRNQSGTMFLSFAAFCRASIARRYSRSAIRIAGSSAR